MRHSGDKKDVFSSPSGVGTRQTNKPQIDNYAGEAYQKKIDSYSESYTTSPSTFDETKFSDQNLATRVKYGKIEQALESTDPEEGIDIAGENTWFNYELREN